ncbi:MAG: DUF504 domain-containing protein [Archaeoglobus sp.]|nr:MAG: DUF504 domain-containing protein [Archaeoglobus sp.]
MKLKEKSVRDILNRLKWDPAFDFSKTEVVYRDRISGLKAVSGEEIDDIGHKFLYLGETVIPIHRVVEIKYSKRTVWRKLNMEKI